jgi:hypothetical protein
MKKNRGGTEMRNRLKTFILFAVVLVIASFVSTGCAKNRVETIQQCYQFKVDQTRLCQENYKEKNGDINISLSTWLVEWGKGENACKVEVFAGYGDKMTCEKVKDLPLKPLENFEIFTRDKDNEKSLSDALVPDKECGEIWLRFVDGDGCNYQIIWIGGIPFKI